MNLAIFWRMWGGFLLGIGVVGIGGGVWGGVLFRHWAGRRWTTALDSGMLKERSPSSFLSYLIID